MKQQGFSLIELLLVLAVIAAIAVTAFLLYPKVQASRASTTETANLNSITAAVKSVYQNGRYAGISNTIGIQANFFPDSQATKDATGSTVVTNQWDGAVTLAPSTSNGGANAATNARYFSITYAGVPKDVCPKLAMAASGNFGGIKIGSTVVGDSYAATPIVLTESAVVTECNKAATSTMIFVTN